MTLMRSEALEAPDVVERLLAANKKACGTLARDWRQRPPRFVATCARGSSDHAATFAKYIIEQYTGLPVVSCAPSISSLYNIKLDVRDALVIAISQSGRSEDLLAFVRDARATGARTLAIVNDQASPLCGVVDAVLPMHAGIEQGVAATKSFIASLAILLQLVAAVTGDSVLASALDRMPDAMRDASSHDWTAATETLRQARSMFVLGRGPALAIAQEAALKLKETCQIHAEAFSMAEVLHGPRAIIGPGFPILAFLQADASLAPNLETLEQLRQSGAEIIAVNSSDSGGGLSVGRSLPANVAPPAMIQSFYLMADAVAAARGLDPDLPRNLKKVTMTR